MVWPMRGLADVVRQITRRAMVVVRRGRVNIYAGKAEFQPAAQSTRIPIGPGGPAAAAELRSAGADEGVRPSMVKFSILRRDGLGVRGFASGASWTQYVFANTFDEFGSQSIVANEKAHVDGAVQAIEKKIEICIGG